MFDPVLFDPVVFDAVDYGWVTPTTTVEVGLSDYEAIVLADNPLVFLRLDDTGTSTTVVDRSGYERDGVAELSLPTRDVLGPLPDGRHGTRFNGADNRIAVDDPILDRTGGPLSLEVWVKIGSGTSGAGLCGTSYTSTGYQLNWHNGTRIDFFIGDAAGVISHNLSSAGWHHIVGTWDGSNNGSYPTFGMHLYVDGVLVTTGGTLITTLSATGFRIGQDNTFFNGDLANVAVYKTVLSAQRVAAHYAAATWTDLTPDLTDTDLQLSYGSQSYRPEIRIADTGTLTFGLRNDDQNSVSTAGAYSPFHASRRTGWQLGRPIRLTQTYAGATRYWWGTLDQIIAEPGIYEGRTVTCVAVDYMDVLAKSDAPTALQVNKRSDEIFTAVLANLDLQPLNRDVDTGADTYAYALDNISADTKALAIYADLARSELGMIYCARDATAGQTLHFESRAARAILSTVLVTLNNSMHAVTLPAGRDDVLNVFRVKAYPRRTSAGIVVATIEAPIAQAIAANETRVITLDYTDPTQRDSLIGVVNGIAPVVTTDYTMNTQVGGGGTDVSANFIVTAEFFASTVQLTIFNAGGPAGYVRTLQVRGDGLYALNPTTAEERNETSIRAYGANVCYVEQPFQSNAFVASGAARYLSQSFADPLAMVASVTFVANPSSALMTAAITGDISSRIALVETMSGLTAAREYFINGIEFSIGETGTQVVTWWLTPASTVEDWQLGVLGADALGNTTRLGY